MKTIRPCLILCVVAWAVLAAAQTSLQPARADTVPPSVAPATQPPASPAIPDAAKVERDVVYGRAGRVELKLDLYYPHGKATGPLPVAVYIHGGGWTKGDKAGGAGMLALGEVLRCGYLVASINYRLAPEFKFPAQIEDAKCAIRYLRAHAKELNLDPERIGVWGSSAGGHLAALVGTADASAGFDTSGGWTNHSSRVRAVVNIFGPADLSPRGELGNLRVGQTVFGAQSSDDPVLKQASPVTHVSADDPPFLLLHGNRDRLVPLSQSQMLLAQLRAAGVPASLVVVTNAGHGFAPVGGTPNPDRQELARMIADFFDQHLRK